jgi:methionyl aminopeptidase
LITLKAPAEIALMREAGRVVAQVLDAVVRAAEAGVTPVDLDQIAAGVMRASGGTSSFLDYRPSWAPTPFPAVTCISVNDVIVHGIPGRQPLRVGDVVSIDCGVELHGYHGDAAVTTVIGDAPADVARLVDTTRAGLEAGIAATVPGARLGDIGHAIETVGRAGGYGILANHGGHGIGTSMHEDPHVANTGRPGRGMPVREGLVLALEPMFHAGGRDGYRTLDDGWSIATDDGSLAAHWEHTIAVTADGPQILTAL